MKSRVLQELRGTPFHPGVRGSAQAQTKLLNETRLAEARVTDDQHQLPFAVLRALPSFRDGCQLLFTANERRQGACGKPTSAAALAHKPIEGHRSRHAFEFV